MHGQSQNIPLSINFPAPRYLHVYMSPAVTSNVQPGRKQSKSGWMVGFSRLPQLAQVTPQIVM